MKGRNKWHIILAIPLTLIFVASFNWLVMELPGIGNFILSLVFSAAIGWLWEKYQTKSAVFPGEFDPVDIYRTMIGGGIAGLIYWIFPQLLTFITKDGPLF